jgi:hypothetical protein
MCCDAQKMEMNMPHFETPVTEEQNLPVHPLLKQLVRDMERYLREFHKTNSACAELGAGYLVVLGRSYENFTAAINRARWDDEESVQERLDVLNAATTELDKAYLAVQSTKRQADVLVLRYPPASQQVLQSPRAKEVLFALSLLHREHAVLSERCLLARTRNAPSQTGA